jgi:hypothetical protein
MFATQRSAFSVLAPLALLLAVAAWTNRSDDASASRQAQASLAENAPQTVAANLPSR